MVGVKGERRGRRRNGKIYVRQGRLRVQVLATELREARPAMPCVIYHRAVPLYRSDRDARGVLIVGSFRINAYARTETVNHFGRSKSFSEDYRS